MRSCKVWRLALQLSKSDQSDRWTLPLSLWAMVVAWAFPCKVYFNPSIFSRHCYIAQEGEWRQSLYIVFKAISWRCGCSSSIAKLNFHCSRSCGDFSMRSMWFRYGQHWIPDSMLTSTLVDLLGANDSQSGMFSAKHNMPVLEQQLCIDNWKLHAGELYCRREFRLILTCTR
jgi:hypothetical protein